jgi:hypothetical protein
MGDVLPAKLVLATYTTVMLCDPVVSVVVENATVPPLRALVASSVAPSINFTLPVGVPPVDVTVAVNVTFWPWLDGFSEEVTADDVVALLTTCESAVDLLAR